MKPESMDRLDIRINDLEFPGAGNLDATSIGDFTPDRINPDHPLYLPLNGLPDVRTLNAVVPKNDRLVAATLQLAAAARGMQRYGERYDKADELIIEANRFGKDVYSIQPFAANRLCTIKCPNPGSVLDHEYRLNVEENRFEARLLSLWLNGDRNNREFEHLFRSSFAVGELAIGLGGFAIVSGILTHLPFVAYPGVVATVTGVIGMGTLAMLEPTISFMQKQLHLRLFQAIVTNPHEFRQNQPPPPDHHGGDLPPLPPSPGGDPAGVLFNPSGNPALPARVHEEVLV